MNHHTNTSRIVAASTTLVVAVGIVVLLCLLHLHYNPLERPSWPPEDTSELLMEGEYVEIGEVPVPNQSDDAQSDNSLAQQPEPDGEDMTDAGPVAPEPPVPATSTKQSPMKTPQATASNTGTKKPVADSTSSAKNKQQQPQRLPTKTVAFSGKNGSESGTSTKSGSGAGNSGSPNGNASSGALSGNVGYNMAGRSISGLSAPKVSSQESLEGKTVTVEIYADPHGRLVGDPKVVSPTNVGDANVRRLCVEKARQVKISANPDAAQKQRGTITFTFSNR